MARKDLACKRLETYNDTFADTVNNYFFDGEEIVKIDELEDAETVTQYDFEGKNHELYRDVAKVWRKNNIRIALFGLENQTEPDEDMVYRILAYDAAVYRGQLINRKSDQPIYPPLTLVLYFGSKPWNKGRTLFESLQPSEKLKPFLNDYKINILEVCDYPVEKTAKMKSSMRYVFEYFHQIKYDKKYVPPTEDVDRVEEVLELLAAYGGENQMLQEFKSMSRQKKGKVTKLSDVMRSMMDKQLKKGEAKGEEKGKIETALSMLRDNMSVQLIMRYTQLSLEKIRELAASIGVAVVMS